jgi:hypothetical protein
MKKPLLLLLVITISGLSLLAQEKKEVDKKKKKNFEPNTAIMIAPTYAAQFPYGNMGDRFGFNNLIGLHLAYKVKKNWMIGLGGRFLVWVQSERRLCY